MNLLRSNNKILLILRGLAAILIVSSILAFIKSIIPLETANNTANINKSMELNFLKMLVPLLVGPVLEELIFRKWIPNTFQDVLGRKKSVIFSNLLFSVLHFDWFIITYFANGLIYSYFYNKSKDIKVPIIMHILYNFSVFLITFF
ncbi:CPBP family intramembrane glutamic endopeptidase (plasmid) [Niallia taxi]|uniref:CPBP family intramembrane glutamic endopeptidase n=1 Tax=Niallia taxi TaxID=2499688 RepID=UPI003F5ECD7B